MMAADPQQVTQNGDRRGIESEQDAAMADATVREPF